MNKTKKFRTLLGGLIISMFLMVINVVSFNNADVTSAYAATEMTTKTITTVFNDGDIDANEYLPKGIKATDVKWAVNKKEIATVTEKGILTPVDFGTVNLYANVKGEKVLKLTVNIVSSNEGKAKPFSAKPESLVDDNNEFYKWYIDNMIIGYSLPEVLKDEIDSVEEMTQYISFSGFSYYAPYPCLVKNGWSNTAIFGAEGALRCGRGVCEDIANVAVYLLQNDYDDIGCIQVTGEYGHMYNYIKQDGIYYVVDFTTLIAGTNYADVWYKDALIWSGTKLTDFSKKSVIYATDTSDTKRTVEDYLEHIIAYSCNHFDFVPSQYRSDNFGHKSVVKGYTISQTKKQFGLEEGIDIIVLYDNKTDDCEWEFISVPSKDIPFFGYSYFSTETIEEKYQRQITEKEGFLDPTGRFDHAYLTRYDN